MQKKKSGVTKCLEMMTIWGGGVRKKKEYIRFFSILFSMILERVSIFSSTYDWIVKSKGEVTTKGSSIYNELRMSHWDRVRLANPHGPFSFFF